MIMGDSAGFGFSAAFCEHIDGLGRARPDKLILFSPWLDVSMSNSAAANYEAADRMLPAYGLVEMGKRWAGDLDLHDYRVSPIFGDISMLQNIYPSVGTREISYPGMTEFYATPRDKGISAELHIGDGMNRVYPPGTNETFEQVRTILQKRGAWRASF